MDAKIGNLEGKQFRAGCHLINHSQDECDSGKDVPACIAHIIGGSGIIKRSYDIRSYYFRYPVAVCIIMKLKVGLYAGGGK